MEESKSNWSKLKGNFHRLKGTYLSRVKTDVYVKDIYKHSKVHLFGERDDLTTCGLTKASHTGRPSVRKFKKGTTNIKEVTCANCIKIYFKENK